jgi:glycine/D-amino acid oxidase-like deaminating enzyme
MKMAVIGAGMMGQAALYDLGQAEGVDKLAVFDIDKDRALDVSRRFTPVYHCRSLDAGNENQAARRSGFGAAVPTTYQHNRPHPGRYKSRLSSGRSGREQRRGQRAAEMAQRHQRRDLPFRRGLAPAWYR